MDSLKVGVRDSDGYAVALAVGDCVPVISAESLGLTDRA